MARPSTVRLTPPRVLSALVLVLSLAAVLAVPALAGSEGGIPGRSRNGMDTEGGTHKRGECLNHDRHLAPSTTLYLPLIFGNPPVPPTPTPTTTPTVRPTISPRAGQWRGDGITFFVTSGRRVGSAYGETGCGSIYVYDYVDIGSDNSFQWTASNGYIRGEFIDSSHAVGDTVYNSIDPPCSDSVRWEASVP